jgi:hypothetical protein
MIPELTNANLNKTDFSQMGLYFVVSLPKGMAPQPIQLPRGTQPNDNARYIPAPTTPPPVLGIETVTRLPIHFTGTGEAFESGSQFDSSLVYGYIDDNFSVNNTVSDEDARKMFRTSFSRMGLAFEHSNWTDARLPKFLRNLLVHQGVSTNKMEPPCATNPAFTFR